MGHPFDSEHFPPFPQVPVILRSIDRSEATDPLLALIDTGSDATLVPSMYIRVLRAAPVERARVRSHWGEPRSVDLYLINLEVNGQVLPGVEVVGDDRGTEILLGRNVLNTLILLLDGLGRQTDVLTRRPRRL